MAKSLDELIDFLLEEVALSGERGLTFSEIAAAVGRFYNPEQEPTNDGLDNPDIVRPRNPSPFSSDRAFLEKVWRWLGRHPDVSIGANHEYDTVTLTDLEHKYPGLLSSLSAHVESSHLSTASSKADKPSKVPDENVTASQSSAGPAPVEEQKGPNVYVTEDRMYIAICGHLPDPSRVFPKEWQLLSYIAAARHNGILQGDLTRFSKQDKRSVPKRTDSLQIKGYIEKRPAYVKGNKTSRLILRRYLVDSKNLPASGSNFSSWIPEKLTIKYQARQMFDLLKNNPLIPQEELAKALGMEGFGQNRVLSQIIRHFGRVGCLKRVKTAFGPSAQSSDLKVCIQWLREPTDLDWNNSGEDAVDFEKSVAELANVFDTANPEQAESDAPGPIEITIPSEEHSSNLQRIIPQWNPDRVLANVFFEASKLSGTKGLTNIEARRFISGTLMRRVMESHLMKISHHSLQSQPAGLKHLAVLRSKQIIHGIGVYFHHAFDTYADMVEKGEAKWTDVGGGDQYLKHIQKQSSKGTHDYSGDFQRDKFGFPTCARPSLQVRGGEASLTDIVSANAPDDINIMNEEPVLRETGSGRVELDVQRNVKRSHARKDVIAGPQRVVKTNRGVRNYTKRNDEDQIALGRPRRFVRGTEKFWRNMFMLAKVQINPDYKRSQSAGLMKDPAGLQLFRNKPSDFDDVLVMALTAHLPVPGEPQEINENWVKATRAVLDRSSNGVYLTPPGMLGGLKTMPSQVLVFKSSRLDEVDFSDRDKVWDWQMVSSSAAHSFAYHRYYPRLAPRTRYPSVPASFSPARKRQGTPRSFGPPKGLFYEDIVEAGVIHPQIARPLPVSNTTNYEEDNRDTDETESDPEIHAILAKKTKSLEEVKAHKSTRRRATSRGAGESSTSILSPPSMTPPERIGSARERSSTRMVIDRLQGYHSERPSPLRNVSTPPVHSETPDPKQNHKKLESIGQSIEAANFSFDEAMQAHITPPAQPLEVIAHSSEEDILCSKGSQTTFQSESEQINSENKASLPAVHQAGATVEKSALEYTSFVRPTDRNEPHCVSLQKDHRDEDQDEAQVHANLLAANNQSITPPESTVENQSMTELVAAANGTDVVPVAQSKTQFAALESTANSRKRGRNVVSDSDEESDPGPPTKRPNLDKMRPLITKHCRSFIIDLVDLCSGLAPLDQATFRRAMIARWHESGIPTKPPSSKIVKTGLHALANSSKLTQITFAFRTKQGKMLTRSIIARREFNATSEEVIALQHKMIEADEEDYVPPELKAEEERLPSTLNKTRPIADYSEHEDKVKTTKPPKKVRISNKSRSFSRRGSTPPPSVNTGFLTLSVPQLHSLDLPVYHQPKYILPVVPPLAAPFATIRMAQKPPSARIGGRRRIRTSRFDPETHNIVWQRPRNASLPTSLEDIPNIRLVRDEVMFTEQLDPAFARFEAEVRCVAMWEEKFAEAFDEESDDLVFINHKVPAANFFSPSSTSYKFETLITFDEDQQEVETELPVERSWPPFVDALHNAEVMSLRILSDTPQPREKRKHTRRVRKDKDDDANMIDDDEPPPKRRKRRQNKPKKGRRGRNKEQDEISQGLVRRVQTIRYISQETRYRIILTVIVVRTLSGGIEKFVDWKSVGRLLPDQELEYLQMVWKSLLYKYRGDVRNLTENFQEKYIEALAKGQVPTANFHDLSATDWEGILDWAMANLDKFSVNKIDDIPATREDFENQNKCSFNEHADFRDMLAYGVSITQPKKEEHVSGIIFGTTLSIAGSRHYHVPELHIASEEDNNDELMSRVRSWVMAVVLTEELSYNPTKTHAKLLKLADTPLACEKIMQKAIKSLQRDKMLSRAPNSSKEIARFDVGVVYGVRSWAASNKFTETLGFRRQINSQMLRTAAKYKLNILDLPFSRHETVIIPKGTALDDGDMVCILNLQTMGVIKIRSGPDKPDTRYGLDWERTGYTTKLIEKSALGFSIVLEPVADSYVVGDPCRSLRRLVPIPRGEIDRTDDLGRIPIWFDINHCLRMDIWDMLLGAIVGLISIRPGIDVKELSRSVLGMISIWEVDMIVEYLQKIGVVKKTTSGNGWETKEWWWMTVGDGEAS